MENKKHISDIISSNDIDNWHNGEAVLISAGCGAGKSYFIKNILYAKARQQDKKILMLIHRSNCVNQFQMEIEKDNKTDVIDIKTYQSVEFQIIKNGNYSFGDYSYIVSEPVHIESKSTQKRVDMRNNTHSFSVNSFYLLVF